MMPRESGDYKISAVNYYMSEDTTREEVFVTEIRHM